MLTQMLPVSSRVCLFRRFGDVLLLELQSAKTAVGLPVAVLPRVILSHNCLAMNVVALIVFAHIILFTPGGTP